MSPTAQPDGPTAALCPGPAALPGWGPEPTALLGSPSLEIQVGGAMPPRPCTLCAGGNCAVQTPSKFAAFTLHWGAPCPRGSQGMWCQSVGSRACGVRRGQAASAQVLQGLVAPSFKLLCSPLPPALRSVMGAVAPGSANCLRGLLALS